MLLGLQAVLLTTFLLFGAALHPTASRATRLGTTVIGTAGGPRWRAGAPCSGWPAAGWNQVYPVAALKAAWKPGRERSTMASLAVSEIRNHPGSSKTVDDLTKPEPCRGLTLSSRARLMGRTLVTAGSRGGA